MDIAAKRLIVLTTLWVGSACSVLTSTDGLTDVGAIDPREAGSDSDANALDARDDDRLPLDAQVDGPAAEGAAPDAGSDASVIDGSGMVDASLADAASDAGKTDAAMSDAATGSAYRAAVLADNPVGYFRFEDVTTAGCVDETTGGVRPYACSYGTSGIVRGVPGIAGSSGVRLGTNQSVVSLAAAAYDFSKPYSIEFWVKLDAVATVTAIAKAEESGPRNGLLAFLFTNSEFRTEIWNGGNLHAYTLAASPLVSQTWHQIVIGHDNSTNAFTYVDGVKSSGGFQYFDAGGPVVTVPLVFREFVGTLEELAVYDKPLAANRIIAHYQLR